MKSTGTFKEFFRKLYEDVTSSSALGTSGTEFTPDNITSSSKTWGDKDDARIPKVLGSGRVQTRFGRVGLLKKRKKKKR